MIRALAVLLLLTLTTACPTTALITPDGELDATGPDAGPPSPDVLRPDTTRGDGPGPMANVYKISPTEDNRKTSQVLLKHITDAKGALTGKFASVWNCVNDPGGQKITLSLGGFTVTATLCTVAQKAKPGPDGSYLHITPPAADTDGSDSFAEIMMYHHVTTLGEHYRNTFGLSQVEKPLRALVNVQGYVDLLSQWVGIANAAYFPKDSADELQKMLGVDLLNGEEAIVFSYNNIDLIPLPKIDFAYDASVIYHEYTHFTVGFQRLYMPAPDQYGIDPTPFALHEALADYFPSSYLKSPKLGTYALGDMARDLTRFFKCPEHISGEPHADGEVASGAFWAARTEVGDKVMDTALWKAVMTFTPATTFEQAATAIVAELKLVAPEKEAALKKIFADHGMTGCVRLMDHQDFEVDPLFGTKKAIRVAGKGEVQGAVFPDGVPGPLQYRVALADTTKEVQIEYAASTDAMMGLPMPGSQAELSVALRKASDPIIYKYTAGQASHTAKVLKGATVAAGGQKLVLTGSCISKGDLIFQFVNQAAGGAQISKVKLTQSPTVTQTTPNFDCP